MTTFGRVVNFFRGGVGTRGPAKTPPVAKAWAAGHQPRPEGGPRNPGSLAKKQERTRIQMRQARDRKRAAANRGSVAQRRARQVLRSKVKNAAPN